MANPLWDYALKIYGANGVASACLALQDRFGLDVNLLLYAAWLAHGDQRLSTEHLIALDVIVADWRERVVQPLRTLRRHLQQSARAADFYEAVKALELRAEQEQLERMYAYFQQSGALLRAPGPLRENLEIVARFGNPRDRAWTSSIDELAALIPA